MNALLGVLRAELLRLGKSPSARWAVLLLALVAPLRVLGSRVAEATLELEGRANTITSGAGWAPLAQGWRTGLVAAGLLLLFHGARALESDRQAGLLRMGTSAGVGRSALFVGRALLGPLLALGAFVLCGAGAYLAARGCWDLGPLVEDGYELLSAEDLSGELRASALSVLPALAALHAFGLAVSALARGSATALAAALTTVLLFDLFKDVLGEARYFVFASFAPTLVDGSALGEMVRVAQGFSDAGTSAELLSAALVVPVAETLLLWTFAGALLQRRAL